MAKLSSLRLDPQAVTDGVWVDYEAGIRVKVARWGNDRFEQELRDLAMPRLKDLRAKRLPAKDLLEITLRAAAKFVLVDWENIDDDEGKAMPYSAETSYAVLSNPEYGDFYRFVRDTANEAAHYRRQLALDAVGN